MIRWILRVIVKTIAFFTIKLAILFWPITLIASGYVYLTYLN